MNGTTPSPLNNVITMTMSGFEMYLAGVSVRRVEDITEALWGTRVLAQLLNGSGAAAAEFTIQGKAALVTWSSREIRAPCYPRAEAPAAGPWRGASGARVRYKAAGPISK